MVWCRVPCSLFEMSQLVGMGSYPVKPGITVIFYDFDSQRQCLNDLETGAVQYHECCCGQGLTVDKVISLNGLREAARSADKVCKQPDEQATGHAPIQCGTAPVQKSLKCSEAQLSPAQLLLEWHMRVSPSVLFFVVETVELQPISDC